jgi:hypothetical protein
MNTEVTIIKDQAETVYVNHPESSYGIFCYNSKGDLFLNSDWGFFGYAWRHYGTPDFKTFLSGASPEYITGKFAINWNQNNPSRANRFGGHREKHVLQLVTAFINSLKQ